MSNIFNFLNLILGQMQFFEASESFDTLNLPDSIVSNVKHFKVYQLLKTLHLLNFIGAQINFLEVD